MNVLASSAGRLSVLGHTLIARPAATAAPLTVISGNLGHTAFNISNLSVNLGMGVHFTYGNPQDIGQQLEEKCIACHPSIHIYLLHLPLQRILIHTLYYLHTYIHTHKVSLLSVIYSAQEQAEFTDNFLFTTLYNSCDCKQCFTVDY